MYVIECARWADHDLDDADRPDVQVEKSIANTVELAVQALRRGWGRKGASRARGDSRWWVRFRWSFGGWLSSVPVVVAPVVA